MEYAKDKYNSIKDWSKDEQTLSEGIAKIFKDCTGFKRRCK